MFRSLDRGRLLSSPTPLTFGDHRFTTAIFQGLLAKLCFQDSLDIVFVGWTTPDVPGVVHDPAAGGSHVDITIQAVLALAT